MVTLIIRRKLRSRGAAIGPGFIARRNFDPGTSVVGMYQRDDRARIFLHLAWMVYLENDVSPGWSNEGIFVCLACWG